MLQGLGSRGKPHPLVGAVVDCPILPKQADRFGGVVSLEPIQQLPDLESLEFKDLEFSYPGRAPILDHVNFQFPMNQTLWLEGVS